MSLSDTALSPQPSAPSEPQQQGSQPAPSAPAAAPEPSSAAPAAAPADKPAMGHNGGPDWRAMMAGEDTKALERLSRFKEPGDVWKSYRELEGKLAKGAEPLKLAENATPEQISEYRKAIGVPDIGPDAKPEAFLDAYKIKAPDGYEMNEVEKGMLAGFAQAMHGAHMPPNLMQAAAGEFFKAQAATKQHMQQLNGDRRKEWQNNLRDTLGSKEYDARKTAASAWLQQQFDGRDEDLHNILGAQLPGGGKLGDHPWFFDMIAEKAMGAGLTDRIEANALESAGKSLGEQQKEIEALWMTDRAAYDAKQKQLDKIITLRISRGELDENGNEVTRRRA
jgi:hypothetical protein